MNNGCKLHLELHKTFFVVTIYDDKLMPCLYNILSNLKSFTYVWNKRIRRAVRQEDKSYYSYNPNTKEYRFTIGILKDVMASFARNGVNKEDVKLTRVNNDNVKKLKNIEFNNNKFMLRDYQQTYSDVLVNRRNDKPIMLVDLNVGMGKSLIASHALCHLNEKTMILVLPKYIEKWIDDLYKYSNVEKGRICVIQGSKTIRDLMNTETDNIDYDFFIASITTMNYMISDYEDPSGTYDTVYPMEPYKFMDHLGVGVILNDETHQHFHALLKVSLYMNVNQIIGLSATLDSNRPEMKRMYNYMFPTENRISNIVPIDRYTNVKVINYRMVTLKGIKYTQPNQGYSHIVFEQSLLRNRTILSNYFDMVYHYVEKDYVDRKLPGERLLVFMSTVTMCTMFTNYLKNKLPDMDIRRYCQDDPYENVITAEISVSTVLSASTAIDIPKLITVINTISMASLQANIQTMGRLRKIPDREVWYLYTYCSMIPNQKNMHKIRRDTIMNRAKYIYYTEYPKYV